MVTATQTQTEQPRLNLKLKADNLSDEDKLAVVSCGHDRADRSEST